MVYLLQDSSSFLLNNLRSRKAVAKRYVIYTKDRRGLNKSARRIKNIYQSPNRTLMWYIPNTKYA